MMLAALARLPYRTRLTLAMLGATLIPLLLLALVLGVLSTAVRGEADQRLVGAARAVAAQLEDGTFDATTAARVAGRTGFAVATYDRDGALLGRSETSLVAGVLPDVRPGVSPGHAPVLTHRGGVTSVFAAVTDRDGLPRGYVELAALQAGALAADLDVGALLALVLGLAVALAVLIGWVLARVLVRPLGSLAAAVSRLGAGHLDERLPVEGEDELAAVAASHNRLADALAARNRSLGLVLRAIAELAPNRGLDALISAAPAAAAKAFGFTDVSVNLAGPGSAARPTLVEDHIPGEAWTFPTLLRAAGEPVGTLWTTIPPTREWAQADQDLLELFAIELGAAIRNAQLFGEVERLSETKSEFLRGVSHNLQTPLTTIRALAAQLAEEVRDGNPAGPTTPLPDRATRAEADSRLAIIVEQSERLSRLVDQLLTVSRLEAGTLRPQVDVFAPGLLVARAWESLGHGDDRLTVRDEATGWLAAADRDRVDQVVWALLDNALKYGQAPIAVTVRTGAEADGLPPGDWLVVTVRDHGPGIDPDDRPRVFERFSRLGESAAGGTGLGLSVARGLVEAMGGRLWIAPTDGPGATFAFSLPAERIEEA